MVRIGKIDYPALSCESPGQFKCTFDCFAARVDKITTAKVARQNGCETLGIFYLG
jgi:hypothetical protein